MIREEDIVHEAGDYWVARERAAYTVYRNRVTHATSDSTYAKTPAGLSIAVARCDYLAGRERSLSCSTKSAKDSSTSPVSTGS